VYERETLIYSGSFDRMDNYVFDERACVCPREIPFLKRERKERKERAFEATNHQTSSNKTHEVETIIKSKKQQT
jgi:hypothetical protein